jgi:hypothetical protein
LSYENLEYVLNRYEEIDIRLLDLLLIVDKDKQSPLHVAIKNKSNRSINIILKKLAKMNINNSNRMKDIFDNLLEFHSFSEYLNQAFF